MSKKENKLSKIFKNNPLITRSALPYEAPPFDKIQGKHFAPAVDWAVKELFREIDAIKDNSDAPNFENTIVAYERAGSDLDRIVRILTVYKCANMTDEFRAINEAVSTKISSAYSQVTTDEALFAKIKHVYDIKDTLGLSSVELRLLEEQYNGQARSGALLEGEDKDRLKAIQEELEVATIKYSQNLRDHSSSFKWIVSKDLLKGVPDRAVAGFEAAAKKEYEKALKSGDMENASVFDGAYMVTLDGAPDILTYCEDRSFREAVFQARCDLCDGGDFDNKQLVSHIVRLRQEKARLLGYDSYAGYVLEDRMAGNVETVTNFLSVNASTYKREAEVSFSRLKEYALSDANLDSFEPYDYSFYYQRLMEETLSLDEEALRPYFELNNVLKGMFEHTEKLFGLKTVEYTGKYPTYRDDARVFEVSDAKSGDLKALLYADFYKDSKVKDAGARALGIRIYQEDGHGDISIPLVMNSLNFEAPNEQGETLLSVREVETLFHEFGHGLHHMLSEGGPYASLNGTNVKKDFVEFPSQIQENWALEPEVLKSYAYHHETGDLIPDEYIDALQAKKKYGMAESELRQVRLGLLDMCFHAQTSDHLMSIDEVEDTAHNMASLWDNRSNRQSLSFGHLFASPDGYASGYYVYKWADVLEADAFETFKEKGLYDATTADKLKTIYASGNTKPPMDLFVEFLGRAPDPNAMYRREGVNVADDAAKGQKNAPKANP